MSSSGGIGERAAGPLHTAVGDLLQLALTPLTDDDVVTLMREVERCARRVTALQHRLLVEADERSLPARFGAKSLKKFLIETLRLAGPDAGARVHQASWVGTFHDMAGETTDPHLPADAASRDHRSPAQRNHDALEAQARLVGAEARFVSVVLSKL
ncbi:hypothetical protein [Nocardia sp. BMG51109]|uniref:hypothetical protein n=1 Tax=Nocardia sp. BMG51109 TaxID=1056816 RepID=UPI0012EC83B0|nr:hypothetical protein [Nocardia sp. BMG51109]